MYGNMVWVNQHPVLYDYRIILGRWLLDLILRQLQWLHIRSHSLVLVIFCLFVLFDFMSLMGYCFISQQTMKLNIHKCSHHDEFVSFTRLNENGWHYYNNYNMVHSLVLSEFKNRFAGHWVIYQAHVIRCLPNPKCMLRIVFLFNIRAKQLLSFLSCYYHPYI